MTPNEREFGELIGTVKALHGQIADMERRNGEDHRAVIQKLDEVQAEVRTRASTEWVRQHETRIDSLEKTRDEGRGAGVAIKVGQGLAVLVLAVAGYFAGGGATP